MQSFDDILTGYFLAPTVADWLATLTSAELPMAISIIKSIKHK